VFIIVHFQSPVLKDVFAGGYYLFVKTALN